MKQQVSNFGRFYTAIREMNPIGDRDEVKRSIVLQYTDGRTESLREMTRAEYDRCCADLEQGTGGRVVGYKAFCQGRFTEDPGSYYVVWEEGILRTSNNIG